MLSASPGFTYRFDPRTNTFERSAAVSGQVYLETAPVIGAGTWNVAISYQYFSAASVEGEDADALRVRKTAPFSRASGTVDVAYRQNLALSLDVHRVTTSVTYGLTDRTEVNVTLPFEHTRFDLDGTLQIGIVDGPTLQADAMQSPPQTATGVGDLLLRLKHRARDDRYGTLSAGLTLRLPTGDEDDLQGTGSVGVFPALYASTRWWRVARGLALRGHVNGGMDFDTESFDRSEGRWGVGGDLGVRERAAVGIAVLGRHAISAVTAPAPPVLCRPRGCAQGLEFGLLGFDVPRWDVYDLALGGRVVLVPERVVMFVNVLVPLNDDGVRADAIPLAGLEVIF